MKTSALTPWDRVQLARHPRRPHTLDYVRALCDAFIELHGDRRYGDDPAIVGGLARFADRTVMIVGYQKGSDARENARRNLGMACPKGYRKALRLFRHAEKFGFPLICFIDTPGADPSTESEERGQGNAIAENILTLAGLRVPIVACVTGEGGSGGALALGVADRLLMLEHAIYSVAAPEAAASILWHDAGKVPEAASAMRITAQTSTTLGSRMRSFPNRKAVRTLMLLLRLRQRDRHCAQRLMRWSGCQPTSCCSATTPDTALLDAFRKANQCWTYLPLFHRFLSRDRNTGEKQCILPGIVSSLPIGSQR